MGLVILTTDTHRVEGVKFLRFPKPKSILDKCLHCIRTCGRPHNQLNVDKITLLSFVCTKHFVNGKPCKEYPDPIPADGTAVRVSRRILDTCDSVENTRSPERRGGELGMAEKRPLQSGQNVDKCAVCDHCKCLSNNLNNCDRCGARLEKDNAVVGYSSETNKRQRLENGDHSNGLRVNGDSRSHTMNPSNQPVPQALYMNTSNISPGPGQAQLRPAALYVNMNNAYPNIPNSVVTPGSGQNFSAIPTSGVNAQMAANISSNMSRNLQALTSMSMPGSLIQGQPMYANNQLPVGTMQNSRQPPPYATPNQSRPSSQMQPSQQPPIRPAQQGQQQSSSPGPNRPVSGQKVSITANQIRIGLRKFTPSANVVFKQEGVMFTLKEYPNAPLLLNARAIVKCKANMVPPFPAFFFYLESSCVKQIRSIFTMREDEFSEKSSIDKVRCISIFPSNIATKDARTIQDTFLYMKTKYQRQDPLLENCTSSDILDIFYGTVSSDPPSSTAQTTNNSQSRPNNRTPNLPSLPSTLPASNVSSSGGLVPSASSLPAGTNPRTIVLPDDPIQWQAMQKSLVVGSIYQVQTRNGEKKYCLWNGSSLVPCLVHDHEVQLQCSQVRIGSLRAPAVGFVRVLNDKNKQEIAFQYKGNDGATLQVAIPLVEIVESLLVCTDRLKAIFLYGNPAGCARIRAICRMGQSSSGDPYYNVTSREERHKHLILYLKDLNVDQKTALLKMKNAANTMVFAEIDLLRALKILSDIKTNSVSQSRIDDYFGRNSNAASDIESQVLQEAGRHDKPKASVAQDDDDDDVIMTQEEIGIKCPYTQQVMQDPMRNKICRHNYEKVAIMEFISRKKLKNIEARCPYAGCGNTIPLRMEDLEENHKLRDYIQQQRKS